MSETAVAANKKTTLSELFDEQGQTQEMLRVLEERLKPVSSPQPTEPGQDRLSDHHLLTAVDNQRQVNRHIKYLLDTLVV